MSDYPEAVYPEEVRIEVELSGEGNGWTELADVLVNAGINIDRGISGTSMKDRIADSGTLRFSLNNSAQNSQATLGLYSTNNVNRLVGWGIGIGARCIIRYNGVDETVFFGTVEDIVPQSGKFRARSVSVSCVDWMDQAAVTKVKGLEIQLNKRSDEIFSLILANVPRQPAAAIAMIGGDTYEYALDNALEEINVMSEFAALAHSEQGYVYVRRDGTLIFESRHKRPNIFTVAESFDDSDIDDVSPGRGRSSIVNRAEVQVHPRRVDAAATSVLFSLASQPQIPRNTSQVFKALYRDPDSRATRTGGLDMIQPVITTDYLFNSLQDGTGVNRSSQLTVTVVFSGNSAEITVLNNGPGDGFLTKLQCRGKGVYSYETVLVTALNQDSIDLYGENTYSLDMPYQSEVPVAKDAAEFAVNQGKALMTPVDGLTFWANREHRLMLAALQLDISSKIHLEETMIGSDLILPVGEEVQEIAALDFFVNSVQLVIGERGIIKCKWGLAPADPFNYWILERDEFTELGQTTRLAYGSFVAGWVLDDSVLGTGTRVNQ